MVDDTQAVIRAANGLAAHLEARIRELETRLAECERKRSEAREYHKAWVEAHDQNVKDVVEHAEAALRVVAAIESLGDSFVIELYATRYAAQCWNNSRQERVFGYGETLMEALEAAVAAKEGR